MPNGAKQRMSSLQKMMGYARAAADEYNMIKDGDRIAVGVSGGKDSLALLCALAGMRDFYPKKFELCAVTVDMGFEGCSFAEVQELCSRLGVEYSIVKTEIAKIIFDYRKENNPCSLCARMRRGVLHNEALRLGCSRVALGHHADDVIDTFMLNTFFEGRLASFQPVTYLSRTGLYLIRPLILAPEKEIAGFARKAKLPVVESLCPANKNTEREEMKKLVADLDHRYRGLRTRTFMAIKRGELDNYPKE